MKNKFNAFMYKGETKVQINIVLTIVTVILYCLILRKNKVLAIAFFAIALTYDVQLLNAGGLTIYLFDILYIVLLLNKVLLVIQGKKLINFTYEKKFILWIITYFYWLIISFLISALFINNRITLLYNMVSLLRYIQIISIVIIIMYYRLEVSEIINIFKYMYLNAILIASFGIIQTYKFKNINYGLRDWWGRTYSVFTSTGPNAFSVYMVFFLLSAICFFIDERIKIKYRFLNLIVFIILFYPFLYSISRTGYLALFIASGFLLTIKRKRLLPIYIFIIITMFVSNSIIYERLIEFTFTNSGLDISSIGRIEYWKGAMATIIRYPVFGVGFNGFSIIGLKYMNYFDTLINAHNEYLQILLNSGVVGFFLFCSIIYKLFKIAMLERKKIRDQFIKNILSIYLATIVALCVSSFFSTPFLNYQVIGQFWIASALILKFKEENKNENSNVYDI